MGCGQRKVRRECHCVRDVVLHPNVLANEPRSQWCKNLQLGRQRLQVRRVCSHQALPGVVGSAVHRQGVGKVPDGSAVSVRGRTVADSQGAGTHPRVVVSTRRAALSPRQITDRAGSPSHIERLNPTPIPPTATTGLIEYGITDVKDTVRTMSNTAIYGAGLASRWACTFPSTYPLQNNPRTALTYSHPRARLRRLRVPRRRCHPAPDDEKRRQLRLDVHVQLPVGALRLGGV
jgi:hypothetical protein